MGIVRDLYYARKMSAGLKLPAPTVALLIKRLRLAAAMGGGVTKTVSGSPAHITDALAKAALSVLASIEPIQDLHGYSNPWPAGGGKNKFDIDDLWENGSTYSSGADANKYIGLAVSPGTYTVSTNVIDNTNANVASVFATVGVNYTQGPSSGACGVFLNRPKTLTVAAGEKIWVYIRTASNTYLVWNENTFASYYIQVESGSTANAWEPYENNCPISGRTGLSVYVSPTQDPDDATVYNVDWTSTAGTVYGGTLDVVSGVLTVDKVAVTINGSTVNTTVMTSYGTLNRFTIAYDNNMPTAKYSGSGSFCLSDKMTPSYNNTVGINTTRPEGYYCFQHSSAFFVSMPSSAITSIAKANSWFAANTPMVCYELATPLMYQLSAQEVRMLLGENYVWSSSGDTVSVTYYAEGDANTLQSLNILLGGNYSNPKTADDVSDKEALEIILGGNK